jgi:hypothetical protein
MAGASAGDGGALEHRGLADETKDTPDPPGGEIQRDRAGNPTGLLIARPNAMILYATLARGPKLPLDQQANSTRHSLESPVQGGFTTIAYRRPSFGKQQIPRIAVSHAASRAIRIIELSALPRTEGAAISVAGWPTVHRNPHRQQRNPHANARRLLSSPARAPAPFEADHAATRGA